MHQRIVFFLSFIASYFSPSMNAGTGLLSKNKIHVESSLSGLKMNGVNFVAPSREIESSALLPLKKISASWVALNPFAFSRAGEPEVYFDRSGQWWGETMKGTRATAGFARAAGLRILIKPHVWVKGQGWPGDFTLDTESDWQIWEEQYGKYILSYAALCEDLDADMFCIGVEYKLAVRQRPLYWKKLIVEVRKLYKGPITYAANWDDYPEVSFWKELDYIGIDAYFPLSEQDTPDVEELVEAWQKPLVEIDTYRRIVKRPVLFTEYGYRSIDKTAWKQWELKDDWTYKGEGNLKAQKNAYEAIYRIFWDKNWFAGGFIWKWYHAHEKSGGSENTDYTPQNKPVEDLIRHYYSRHN